MMHRMLPVAAALALLSGSALAQNAPAAKPADPKPAAAPKAQPEVTLKVGSRAPGLTIDKWVKGEPVTGFEKGKIYVVEFWATWCGPCIQSMPHLSELQQEFKDKGVTIIGVSSRDPNNSLDAVEKMVAEKGPTMGYTVAWDKERDTYASYMTASGSRGIPTAFVVDGKGEIAYIGHPMWLDLPLKGLVEGTWDTKAGAETIAAAEKKLDAIFSSDDSDPKATLAQIDAFSKEHPSAAYVLEDMRYPMMAASEDPRAAAFGRELVEKHTKAANAGALNAVARGIIDPKATIKNRDLDLALLAATRAAEITKFERPRTLAVLAQVHSARGEIDKAIEIQTKAVEKSDERLKPSMEKALADYKAAKK